MSHQDFLIYPYDPDLNEHTLITFTGKTINYMDCHPLWRLLFTLRLDSEDYGIALADNSILYPDGSKYSNDLELVQKPREQELTQEPHNPFSKVNILKFNLNIPEEYRGEGYWIVPFHMLFDLNWRESTRSTPYLLRTRGTLVFNGKRLLPGKPYKYSHMWGGYKVDDIRDQYAVLRVMKDHFKVVSVINDKN
mgnify:CR=1 FL=1